MTDRLKIDIRERNRKVITIVSLHQLDDMLYSIQLALISRSLKLDRLLIDEDYRVNFSIKSALERCFQPKSERLISKISTASEHKPEKDAEGIAEKYFQMIVVSWIVCLKKVMIIMSLNRGRRPHH